MASLEQLVMRIRRGDRDAFDDLCRETYGTLISYARIFLSSVWAEDVVQDVLFGLWKHRESIVGEGGGNIKGYLLRSVYNRSLNYLKKRNHFEEYSSDYKRQIGELMISYYSPDKNPVIEAIFDTERRDLVRDAIEELSPRCKEVFKLSFYDGLSNRQICERLGLSLSTVENHKYLAMKGLRFSLAKLENI